MTNNNEEKRRNKMQRKKGDTGKKGTGEKRGQATFFLKSFLSPFFPFFFCPFFLYAAAEKSK